MLQDDIIQYWTARAPSYSEINQNELHGRQKEKWTRYITKRIFEAISDTKGLKVLDIGGGPGFFSIIMTMAGYEATWVDRNDAMLVEAKKNAGPLAERIHYELMDAEELTFPENTFDVIVTRNLTWTLPHPKKAYASWIRVLKPGGVILNFDANWYNYLYNEEDRKLYERDREQVEEAGVFDRYISTDVATCERIAREMPLSPVKRPHWDKDVLESLGMEVILHEKISEEILLPEELLNFEATPYFCVEARKIKVRSEE